jgi:tetratricopeptide (TPR) repeat protein
LFYLARSNYDLGRYAAAIDAVNQLIKINADHDSFLANAYSLGADAYAKLGRDEDSRRYYSLALVTDPVENHWALTGLVGE